MSILNGPTAGATASIPAGAFIQPTMVAITGASLPPIGGFSAVGPAFTLSPEGVALLNSSSVAVTAPAAPPANVSLSSVVVLLKARDGSISVLTPSSSTASAVGVSTTTFGTFEAVVLVPVDPAGSTATITPSSVPADGTSLATITLVVLDTNGVGVPNAAVSLTSTGTNTTVSQPNPTDSTGKTAATIASTMAETKTISVSVVPASGGTAVALQAQPTVQFN